VNRNIKLLYGFSCFDQFMIVIALWVPYLATKGIGMQQFMELQAVFAIVILCGEVPSGLLSDLWGRKKTLLLGSTLKAVSFSLLPLWSSYEGFLIYHLTMGIALSMISGGDVALLYDSHLAAGGEKSRGTAILGNAKLAAQIGATVSALLGGATTLVGDTATRLVFLNLVASGTGGLVMFWVNQKYWQESGVPLAYFGVLLAGYSLIFGFAGKSAALGSARLGRRPLLAAAGALPIIACFGMASFLGWGGILLGTLGQVGRGLGGVLFLNTLNEKISSAFRATVISMASLGTRASFCLLGPLVGYGIDVWGLPSVLSALGILFSTAFVVLLLPLVGRERSLSRAEGVKQ
jgi:MFS family permease